MTTTPEPADLRFRPEHHLRRPADFDRVYKMRQSARGAAIQVFGARNGLPHSRLGLSVGRRVGGAVVRNRWKRLVREAFRLIRAELHSGWDLIVIPRAPVPPSLEVLQTDLRRLTDQLQRRRARTPQ